MKNGIWPDIDKELYCTYTKNIEENRKLKTARKLIRALNEISEYAHVYPFDIVKATSGFVNYNMITKEYTLRTG